MERVWLARSHLKSAKLALCVCVCVGFEGMSIIRLIGTGNGASLRAGEG